MFTKTFALLHRGLRHDARLLKVHLLRLGMVLIVVGMLFITHIASMTMGSPGLSFFREITWITFIFATLAGTTFFATAVTEEKEEQTLGLLALADIRPLSLILGKFLPRLVGALLILSVLFPFTLLSITLGGVTWGQIWAAYWTLFAHVVLLGTIGLVCSVVCRRSGFAVLLTVVAVTGFLALPAVVNSLLSSLLTAGIAIPAASRWQAFTAAAIDTSAIPRISDMMKTGFNDGPFGLQVVSNLAGAALLFLASWVLFAPFNRQNVSTTETVSWFTRGVRWTRVSRRCWSWPLVWKDFHYLVGGVAGWFVRAMLYVVLAGAVGFATNSFRLDGQLRLAVGEALMIVAPAAAALELVLTASCLFPAEVRQGTWPSLATLPVPVGHVAYGKVVGACLGLVPAVACVLLGAGLAGEAVVDAFIDGRAFLELFRFVLLAVIHLVLLHLIVLYSLLLNQWAAFPMALLTMFVGSCLTSGITIPAIIIVGAAGNSVGELFPMMIGCSIFGVVAIGICSGLQFMIAQRLRVLGGL